MTRHRLYTFHIDDLSPETLSMKELAKYLDDLAELIGEESSIHFDKVTKGSAQLKWWPEERVENDVRARLEMVDEFINYREMHDPIIKLNKRLANDKASARMLDPDMQEIAKFPGKGFKQFKDVPAFWQVDRLQGRLIRIGGKDESIHAHIDMGGKVLPHISMSTELAKDVVKYFLGPILAFNGKAKWQRNYIGEWKLLAFQVHSFDILEENGLEETVDRVGQYIRDGIGQAETLYPDIQSEASDE